MALEDLEPEYGNPLRGPPSSYMERAADTERLRQEQALGGLDTGLPPGPPSVPPRASSSHLEGPTGSYGSASTRPQPAAYTSSPWRGGEPGQPVGVDHGVPSQQRYGAGGAVSPGLRQPAATRSSMRSAIFEITQFDPAWGTPPERIQDGLLRWNPARYVYELTSRPYGASGRQAWDRLRDWMDHGVFAQAHLEGNALWRYRWVRVPTALPERGRPYVVLGPAFEEGDRLMGRFAPTTPAPNLQAPAMPAPDVRMPRALEGFREEPLFGYLSDERYAPPPAEPRMQDFAWIPQRDLPVGCPYPYEFMPVPLEDYHSGAWLESGYIPSRTLPYPHDGIEWKCWNVPTEPSGRGKGGGPPPPTTQPPPRGPKQPAPPALPEAKRPPAPVTPSGGSPSSEEPSVPSPPKPAPKPEPAPEEPDISGGSPGLVFAMRGSGAGESPDVDPALEEIGDPTSGMEAYDADTEQALAVDKGVEAAEAEVYKLDKEAREAQRAYANAPSGKKDKAHRDLERAKKRLDKAQKNWEGARRKAARGHNRKRAKEAKRRAAELKAKRSSTSNRSKRDDLTEEILGAEAAVRYYEDQLDTITLREAEEAWRAVAGDAWNEEKLRAEMQTAKAQRKANRAERNAKAQRSAVQLERVDLSRAKRDAAELGRRIAKLEYEQRNTWSATRRERIDKDIAAARAQLAQANSVIAMHRAATSIAKGVGAAAKAIAKARPAPALPPDQAAPAGQPLDGPVQGQGKGGVAPQPTPDSLSSPFGAMSVAELQATAAGGAHGRGTPAKEQALAELQRRLKLALETAPNRSTAFARSEEIRKLRDAIRMASGAMGTVETRDREIEEPRTTTGEPTAGGALPEGDTRGTSTARGERVLRDCIKPGVFRLERSDDVGPGGGFFIKNNPDGTPGVVAWQAGGSMYTLRGADTLREFTKRYNAANSLPKDDPDYQKVDMVGLSMECTRSAKDAMASLSRELGGLVGALGLEEITRILRGATDRYIDSPVMDAIASWAAGGEPTPEMKRAAALEMGTDLLLGMIVTAATAGTYVVGKKIFGRIQRTKARNAILQSLESKTSRVSRRELRKSADEILRKAEADALRTIKASGDRIRKVDYVKIAREQRRKIRSKRYRAQRRGDAEPHSTVDEPTHTTTARRADEPPPPPDHPPRRTGERGGTDDVPGNRSRGGTRQGGARELGPNDWDAAEPVYESIRNTDDVSTIAKSTGWSERHIQTVKDHVFYRKHRLDDGVERFAADPEIANAWRRLQRGTHTDGDLRLLEHELFEAKFERIFKTDYRTAHDAANRSGRPSGLEFGE